MAKFVKGQSGNLQGKPKGCRDKRQFSLTYWYNLIQDQWAELTPNQRANIALDCWKVLVNKAKSLPTDPNDSRLNAETASKLLAEAEAKPLTQVNIVTKPDVNKTI